MDHRHYENISEVIDPVLLLSFLEETSGEGVEISAENDNGVLSAEEHAARQFVGCFRARMKQSSVEDQQTASLMTVEEARSAVNAEATTRENSGEQPAQDDPRDEL